MFWWNCFNWYQTVPWSCFETIKVFFFYEEWSFKYDIIYSVGFSGVSVSYIVNLLSKKWRHKARLRKNRHEASAMIWTRLIIPPKQYHVLARTKNWKKLQWKNFIRMQQTRKKIVFAFVSDNSPLSPSGGIRSFTSFN